MTILQVLDKTFSAFQVGAGVTLATIPPSGAAIIAPQSGGGGGSSDGRYDWKKRGRQECERNFDAASVRERAWSLW